MRYLHTMIRVEKLEESLKFFCEGLGFKELYRKENPQGQFTLIFLAAPEDYEHALQNKSPCLELTYNWPKDGKSETYSGGRNFGHIAIEVDDIYATCKHLMNMGVTINRPPRDGRMAFVRSPENISIELLQKGSSVTLPKEQAKEQTEPWLSMPNCGEW